MTAEERDRYWAARNLANMAMAGVTLQIERLMQNKLLADGDTTKKLVDFQFLIVALWRLRRAAQLAHSMTNSSVISHTLSEFDRAMPDLKDMRDAAEHRDEYESGKGHKGRIKKQALTIHIHDSPNEWRWAGFSLDLDEAAQQSNMLFAAIIESEPPVNEKGA